jgi:molybdopterin converting factor small subunit
VVTIEFWGVAAIGGGRRRLHLPITEPATVSLVLELAGIQLENATLLEDLGETHMILVNGDNIAYLQQRDTIVRPGDQLSVVLPMAGG